MYYPGTTEVNGATPIDLRSGGSADGIDIAVGAGPVRTRHIRGVVTEPATGQPVVQAQVLADPADVGPEPRDSERSVQARRILRHCRRGARILFPRGQRSRPHRHRAAPGRRRQRRQRGDCHDHRFSGGRENRGRGTAAQRRRGEHVESADLPAARSGHPGHAGQRAGIQPSPGGRRLVRAARRAARRFSRHVRTSRGDAQILFASGGHVHQVDAVRERGRAGSGLHVTGSSRDQLEIVIGANAGTDQRHRHQCEAAGRWRASRSWPCRMPANVPEATATSRSRAMSPDDFESRASRQATIPCSHSKTSKRAHGRILKSCDRMGAAAPPFACRRQRRERALTVITDRRHELGRACRLRVHARHRDRSRALERA